MRHQWEYDWKMFVLLLPVFLHVMYRVTAENGPRAEVASVRLLFTEETTQAGNPNSRSLSTLNERTLEKGQIKVPQGPPVAAKVSSQKSGTQKKLELFQHIVKKHTEELKEDFLEMMMKPKGTLNTKQRCYKEIGCFKEEENMGLPMAAPKSPEDVGVAFYFFTDPSSKDLHELLDIQGKKEMPEKAWTLDNWTLSKMKERQQPFYKDRPITVVAHGFHGSKRSAWVESLTEALLKNRTCTVLVVDWRKGASGSYPEAAVNAPMTGVITSLFLQKMMKETKLAFTFEKFALIGFSLGAHAMGFAGRHFKMTTKTLISRITGLDPAGYYFEGAPFALSKSDAGYVDVIHSNSGKLTNLKLSLKSPIGHVDFYPNGGKTQPGCPRIPKLTKFMESLKCNHHRAAYLYIESMNNHKCSFKSYRCKNWPEYVSGLCQKKAKPDDIGLLGYYSFTAKGRGTQYLYTNKKTPFCIEDVEGPTKQKTPPPRLPER